MSENVTLTNNNTNPQRTSSYELIYRRLHFCVDREVRAWLTWLIDLHANDWRVSTQYLLRQWTTEAPMASPVLRESNPRIRALESGLSTRTTASDKAGSKEGKET